MYAEESDAQETQLAVEAEGRADCLIAGDVTDPKFCKSVIETTVERFGQLDILVNNAAYQQTYARLEDISDDEWDLTFRTNIYGYFYMVKAALPYLKEGSAIINRGSITGLEGSATLIDYASTNPQSRPIDSLMKILSTKPNWKQIDDRIQSSKQSFRFPHWPG